MSSYYTAMLAGGFGAPLLLLAGSALLVAYAFGTNIPAAAAGICVVAVVWAVLSELTAKPPIWRLRASQ